MKSMSKQAVLIILSYPLSFIANADTNNSDINDNDYVFDTTLLKGSGLPVDDIINYLANDKVKPGTYSMDVQLNGVFLFHDNVIFRAKGNDALPCFSTRQLSQLPLKEPIQQSAVDTCASLQDYLPKAGLTTDMGFVE